MSKAAHNGCQARADIPTGLGMHQESTFAMSRLRHKRAAGKIRPAAACVWVLGFSQRSLRLMASVVSLPNEQQNGCELNSFRLLRRLKCGRIMNDCSDLSRISGVWLGRFGVFWVVVLCCFFHVHRPVKTSSYGCVLVSGRMQTVKLGWKFWRRSLSWTQQEGF